MGRENRAEREMILNFAARPGWKSPSLLLVMLV